jgi:hypothetical protein
VRRDGQGPPAVVRSVLSVEPHVIFRPRFSHAAKPFGRLNSTPFTCTVGTIDYVESPSEDASGCRLRGRIAVLVITV